MEIPYKADGILWGLMGLHGIPFGLYGILWDPKGISQSDLPRGNVRFLFVDKFQKALDRC